MSIQTLFSSPLRVVNVGIESFKEACVQAGTEAVQVDWRPPVDVAPDAEAILAKRQARIKSQPEGAGYYSGRHARWWGWTLRNVIPGMTDNTILHAGPPITGPDVRADARRNHGGPRV